MVQIEADEGAAEGDLVLSATVRFKRSAELRNASLGVALVLFFLSIYLWHDVLKWPVAPSVLLMIASFAAPLVVFAGIERRVLREPSRVAEAELERQVRVALSSGRLPVHLV